MTSLPEELDFTLPDEESPFALRLLAQAWLGTQGKRGVLHGVEVCPPENLAEWLEPFGGGSVKEVAGRMEGASGAAEALFEAVSTGSTQEIARTATEYVRVTEPRR
jgi:hypothetical protein